MKGNNRSFFIIIILIYLCYIASPLFLSNYSVNNFNFINIGFSKEINSELDSINNEFNDSKLQQILEKFNFNEINNNEWSKDFQKADKNFNGINDQFEPKLFELSRMKNLQEIKPNKEMFLSDEDIINEILGNKKQTLEEISYDNIPIIIQFSDGDFESYSSLFMSLGGKVKSIYKTSINGFAGTIDFEGLSRFCELLKLDNKQFLLEEDVRLEANLYYNSRNMNLRPYVWNTLNYTGDTNSSIAIIDTGIDDFHNFFRPGYSSGNSAYKIVGWNDVVNGLSSPYDDEGHGSHCAGIAAGEGSPKYDISGRSVSTFSYGLNLSGGYIFLGGYLDLIGGRFNVTDPGLIEINCNFNDYTPAPDDVDIYAYLYRGESVVDSYVSGASSWSDTLTYTATASTLGDYSLRIRIILRDVNGDWFVDEPIFGFTGTIHWPFNPPEMGSGDRYKGIAPDAQLVGIKVLDETGGGWESDIVAGVNWAINNKLSYNITTISMSLGYDTGGHTSIINAVNNAVANGIVTVVAAGNEGGIGNNIGSPGDADKVITVAAMNYEDRVTDYSSAGRTSYSGQTIKPDIMAPGGSYNSLTIFSTDTNDQDANGISTDIYLNDTYPAVGTSMATPAVAGATNLLIEAMGGYSNWNYTEEEAGRVKALLLMTATETYPLTREVDTGYSPVLNRGGKDYHEGYGRINIDAAIEAYTQKLTEGTYNSSWLSSSLINPFNKHALGCYVDLIAGEEYYFNLFVPDGTDFDLHLYNNTPTLVGDPILVASSTSSILGMDEFFRYIPNASGRHYLIAKAISGEGIANFTYKTNMLPPNLTNGSVTPTTGNQSTLLNFSVIYTEPEGYPPTSINVLINGTPYPMEKQNISDNSYTDGCAYQCLTYLQPGSYNYSFECWDGKYYNFTNTYFGINIVEANLLSPTLTNGQIYPNEGYANWTTFKFRVTYTDADNNAPSYVNVTINTTSYSMIKQNPLDTNYMDGCIFMLNTELDIGNYYFYFNSSDNTYNASTGPFSGPIVDKFKEGLILFNGMYYSWQLKFGTITFSMSARCTYLGGNTYRITENNPFTSYLFWFSSTDSRDVNNLTRVISNSINSYDNYYVLFENDTWEPFCIFNNVSMGDFIPIATSLWFTADSNRTFQITGEKNISRFGRVLDCWELTDVRGSVAYYEKVTGLLVSAYIVGDGSDYSINVTKTNVFPAGSTSFPNLSFLLLLLVPSSSPPIIFILIIAIVVVAGITGILGVAIHQKHKEVYISKPPKPSEPPERKKPKEKRKPSRPKIKNEKVEAWKDQGDIFRAERNYEKAYECYQRALEIDPEDIRAKVMIGLLQDKISSSTSQAESPSTIIKEQIEKKPEQITVKPSITPEETPEERAKSLFDQGFDFFKVGEYQRSIFYFEKTIELNPQFKDAWYSLGVAHMNLGNDQKAIECLTNELEIDPSNKLAKAFLNSLKKKYLKTEVETKPISSEFKEILKEDANELFTKGKDFFNSANYLNAVEYFEKAVKINPNLKEAWYELGLSHASLGNMQKVIEAHKRVVEIDPQFKEAWKFLGTAHLSLRNHQEAINSYKKVLELDPQDKYAWFYMSKCYEKLENYQQMVQCLVNVLNIDSKDKRAWYNLGDVYERLGHNKEALEYYTNVYNIDPQYKQVLEKINSLKNKI